MRALRLSRACRNACRSLPEDFEEMRDEILDLYHAHGTTATETLNLECAFFIHWCTEIGLRNATGNFIDRWLARKTLDRSLQSIGMHIPHLTHALPGDPVEFYRQRYREALYRIHNIYVRHSPDGGLEMPLTPRLARHFVHHTGGLGATSSRPLIEDMHRRLSAICERHVARFLADAS